MKQTAVELLKQRLIKDQQVFPIYTEYINGILYDIDNELLEMEKQQQDDFAIEFTEWKDKFIREIDDWKQDGVYLKNNYSIKELLEIFKNK